MKYDIGDVLKLQDGRVITITSTPENVRPVGREGTNVMRNRYWATLSSRNDGRSYYFNNASLVGATIIMTDARKEEATMSVPGHTAEIIIEDGCTRVEVTCGYAANDHTRPCYNDDPNYGDDWCRYRDGLYDIDEEALHGEWRSGPLAILHAEDVNGDDDAWRLELAGVHGGPGMTSIVAAGQEWHLEPQTEPAEPMPLTGARRDQLLSEF